MDQTSTFDLRIDADWIIPIEPQLALARHSLLIDEGKIIALLPWAEADAYPVREHLKLPQHVLLPGLINAHTHMAMNLFRGIADDVPLQIWLQQHIWPREAEHISEQFVFDGSLLAAAEMLRGGITCCQDMYFYPDAAARAIRQSGMRAMLGLPIIEFPTRYASDAQSYLQRGLAIRDQLKHDDKLGFSLAPHAPYTVSDSTFDLLMTYAEELNLPVQTHLHETAQEITDSLNQYHLRPLTRLQQLNVTGPNFMAVHAVHMNDADLAVMQAQACHVIHCPSSNLKLASGIAPVSKMLAHSINVALGSDGAASNNRLDLFEEVRLAALLTKAQSGDAAQLPALNALTMATLNGARALGWENRIGSLQPGKTADVIAINLDSLESSPYYDPSSHLVYVAGRNDVTHVWVAGECLIKERQFTRLDPQELIAKARYWQQKLV